MLSEEDKIQIAEQIALSKSLALGFALSLLPVAGVGSIVAIVIGIRARKTIEASGEKLVGLGIAAWCIGAGVIGLIANVFFVWPIVFRL
ncbi:MAG: hypothetical protein ABIR80_03700 [Opitutaceae bacterium]